MHEELDPIAGAATELDPELPPEEQDHPGHELIDGVWVEKGMSNLAAVVEGNLIFAVKGFAREPPGVRPLRERTIPTVRGQSEAGAPAGPVVHPRGAVPQRRAP
jgi:hypothetical protein